VEVSDEDATEQLNCALFKPDAAHQLFFYGINFEFCYNAAHWDQNRYTQEIRPIIGWHLRPVDLIVNRILDNRHRLVSSVWLDPTRESVTSCCAGEVKPMVCRGRVLNSA
jgi:hypothetical protein